MDNENNAQTINKYTTCEEDLNQVTASLNFFISSNEKLRNDNDKLKNENEALKAQVEYLNQEIENLRKILEKCSTKQTIFSKVTVIKNEPSYSQKFNTLSK